MKINTISKCSAKRVALATSLAMALLSCVANATHDPMCISPLPAWIGGVTKNGKPKLVFTAKDGYTENPVYFLPCGKCIGCQYDRMQRWISRLTLEANTHNDVGTFITLTYAKAPSNVCKSDVQKFLKRFRNLPRDYDISLDGFKYFFCAEYGSQFGRPHYHGLLFGVDCFAPCFDTKIVTFKNHYPVYSSQVLADVWNKGFITVDRITPANIRYVSKYLMKCHQKKGDEFTLKSIGLGADFFFDFPTDSRQDVARGLYFDDYAKGILHMSNKYGKYNALAIPKCYDRYLAKVDESLLDEIKARRSEFVKNHKKTTADFNRRRLWLETMTVNKPNERILHND